MKDVIIKVREQGESHTQDEIMYRKLNQALAAYALELQATGAYTDHELIAISVRAAQQLAANSTALAAEMGVDVELAK